MHGDSNYHHKSHRMHTENGIGRQLVTKRHHQSRKRDDEHANDHGREGCSLFHKGSNKIHQHKHHQRIYIGIPARRGSVAYHTDYIFGHCSVHLALYHPKSTDNQYQCKQSAIRQDFNHIAPNLPETFSFAGRLTG